MKTKIQNTFTEDKRNETDANQAGTSKKQSQNDLYYKRSFETAKKIEKDKQIGFIRLALSERKGFKALSFFPLI